MNRAVMAARAAQSNRPARSSGATSSTNLLMRVNSGTATGPVRRSRAVSLTATQRNSLGKRSEWAESPEFFTDPKWSATAYKNRAV